MKLIVEDLESSSDIAGTLAAFDKPLSKQSIEDLREYGFLAARGLGRHCMNWIWSQWLLEGSVDQIRAKVGTLVDKGMAMQDHSDHYYMRAQADLYLLHCAIFASSQSQLEELARRVVDLSGSGGHKPEDRGGELYASAWCGMLKHWILGDVDEAKHQAESIWGAYRDASFAGASKLLVSPWIKGDWTGFVKAQRKDFEKLWARGRKDGTVRSENQHETVVTVDRFPIEQKWCWAHCGLALLAYRRGVDVATDPFWFPVHALRCVEVTK